MAKSFRTYIWQDRKRHLRLPWSFTRYMLTEDRLFIDTGFLRRKEEEILLYRIQDITLLLGLGQRMLGMGTIVVKSSDLSVPSIELKNILRPREVKELLSNKIEEAKMRMRVRPTEVIDVDADLNHNGIPDYLEHHTQY